MHLWDVYALEELENEGTYRSLVKLPNGDPKPDTTVDGYEWIIIARNVSPDEAEAVMDSYPQVSRARC